MRVHAAPFRSFHSRPRSQRPAPLLCTFGLMGFLLHLFDYAGELDCFALCSVGCSRFQLFCERRIGGLGAKAFQRDPPRLGRSLLALDEIRLLKACHIPRSQFLTFADEAHQPRQGRRSGFKVIISRRDPALSFRGRRSLQRLPPSLTRLFPRAELVPGFFQSKDLIVGKDFPSIAVRRRAPVLYFDSKMARDRRCVHPMKLHKERVGLVRTAAAVVQFPLALMRFATLFYKYRSPVGKTGQNRTDSVALRPAKSRSLDPHHAAIQTSSGCLPSAPQPPRQPEHL